MAHQVQVNQNEIVLPDGREYGSGAVVTLTDREFNQIRPALFELVEAAPGSSVLTDLGEVAGTSGDLSDLGDVAIDSPQDGDVMKWVGTHWVNAQPTPDIDVGGEAGSLLPLANDWLNTNTFEPPGTDAVAVIVRGLAGQANNLQEWRAADTSVLATLDRNGSFTSYRGGVAAENASGTSPVLYAGNISANASAVVAIIQGGSPQTGDLTQWKNSSGAILAEVNANGVFTAGAVNAGVMMPTAWAGARLVAQAQAASDIVALLKGYTGQSADLLQFQNAAGTVMGGFSGTGSTSLFYLTGASYGYHYGGINQATRLYIASDSSGTINAIFRATSGQTADVQQWQDSTGSLLAAVQFSGSLDLSPTSGGSIGTALRITTASGGPWSQTWARSDVAASSWHVFIGGGGGADWLLCGNDGLAKAAVGQDGSLTAGAATWLMAKENGGAVQTITKSTAPAANPGAGLLKLYVRDGTSGGTLKLVVRAGASGAETVVLDNIPT